MWTLEKKATGTPTSRLILMAGGTPQTSRKVPLDNCLHGLFTLEPVTRLFVGALKCDAVLMDKITCLHLKVGLYSFLLLHTRYNVFQPA